MMSLDPVRTTRAPCQSNKRDADRDRHPYRGNGSRDPTFQHAAQRSIADLEMGDARQKGTVVITHSYGC